MKIPILLLLSSYSIFANAVPLSSIITDVEQSIIIGDKQGGKIIVYNAKDKSLYSSSALYGKTIADEFASDKDTSATITPAGTFTSTKAYSSHLNEDVTAFLKRGRTLVAIHPVWTGTPSQHRPQRLASPQAEDNRITNGCVNVPLKFYYDIIDKLKTGTTVKILMENETVEDDISGTDFFTKNTKTVQTEPVLPVIYNEVKATNSTDTKEPVLSIDELAGAAGAAGLY